MKKDKKPIRVLDISWGSNLCRGKLTLRSTNNRELDEIMRVFMNNKVLELNKLVAALNFNPESIVMYKVEEELIRKARKMIRKEIVSILGKELFGDKFNIDEVLKDLDKYFKDLFGDK